MKTKIIAFTFTVVMFLALPISQAQNLLTDGDFSTTTEILPFDGWYPSNAWCYQMDWDAYGIPSVIDGVCNYQVINGGYGTWSVQLVQAGFPLEAGHLYRYSFDAKADADRIFGIYLGENWGNWTTLIGWDNYYQSATTTWQTYTFEFKLTCDYYYYILTFEIGSENVNMYFDNVMLEDLGPYEPSIGIIGTSVYGWSDDHDMLTDDGINYYLNDFPLTSGKVKFRQDDSWCINWGMETFPTGIAYSYGPDLVINNGSIYDINFNIVTGEYSFVCVDNCYPFIGINGSSVPPDFGYGPDVNLSTNDGIFYNLPFYIFMDGDAKFYQDDQITMNWGGLTFPSGIALPGGPGIPVPMGNYNVNFNLFTEEYSFDFPSIGILGTSLDGWYDDIDMFTSDGIIYSLTDYPFVAGEVKFRLNDNWDVNWGSWEFPAGYGWQDGPNIPVFEGRYNVSFNLNTGEYSFEGTTCPLPGIQCPGFTWALSDPGKCSAVVYYPDVVPAAYCGGDGLTIEQTEGLPSGSEFPTGYTTNSFLLTNSEGNTASCSFDVYVYDIEPPVMTGLTDEFEPLWPPNHQMVPIFIDYELSDNCSIPYSFMYVFSNEPEEGLGDGDLAPDWIIYDEHNLELRAERSGTGDGRIYEIYIIYYDENWNSNYAVVTVTVPHHKGKNKESALVSDIQNSIPEVNIWPNPSIANFNLSVKSASGEAIQMYVTDLTGRLISDQKIISSQQVSFGDELNPGVYFVQIKQGSFTKSFKILRQ